MTSRIWTATMSPEGNVGGWGVFGVVGSQCACGQARGYKGANCNQTKRPTHLTQQGESKCVCGEISNLYFCTSSDICSPGSFSRLQSPILWVYSIIDKVYKLAGKLQIVNCLLSSLRPRNHPAHGGLWWCFCCKSVFGIVCAFLNHALCFLVVFCRWNKISFYNIA